MLLRAQEVGILFRLLQVELSLTAEYILKRTSPQVNKQAPDACSILFVGASGQEIGLRAVYRFNRA